MSRVVVVTSGKGGVGKTTTSAAISSGLAMHGKRTCVVDFDVGLRNLDLVMGCERRVIFDLINVMTKEVNLNQALIKDKKLNNLFILPASQTRDKDSLSLEALREVIDELRQQFDYVVCDSPAGIEKGAIAAMYYADEAIVVTNPEISSVHDSDTIVGTLSAKSERALLGAEPIKEHLLITRYNPRRVKLGEMLSIEDILGVLDIPLLGVVPDSQAVLKASNMGVPVIHQQQCDAGQAYMDAVSRLLGEKIPLRFTAEKQKGILESLFGITGDQ